jgi:hypothetical protein
VSSFVFECPLAKYQTHACPHLEMRLKKPELQIAEIREEIRKRAA